MNHSFKKRLLYIFSDKKAESIGDTDTTIKQMVWLILAVILTAILVIIILNIKKIISSPLS